MARSATAPTAPRKFVQIGDNTRAQGQIAKANELLAEVAEFDGEYANQVWAEFKATWGQGTCTFEFVSGHISSMIAVKRASTKVATVRDLPGVPKGRYAITGADGSTDFYWLTFDKDGKVKLSLYISDKKQPVTNWQHIVKVIRQIAADGVHEASVRWGLEMRKCWACGAKLTDQKNPYRELGLGPDCGPQHA